MAEWTRRDFLKTAAAGLAALPLAGLGGCARRGPAPRPNFLFILADDHRYDALSCAGHPWLRTPALDKVAASGVRFSNAFVTTSLCSPSRGSFLTGCYAHAHGVVANETQDPDPSLPAFPLLLQQAGYETAFIGKWHMARWATPRPGFDSWTSFHGQGDYARNTLNVDGLWTLSQQYVTSELTVRADAFLRRPRRRPFLLWLSHKAVHEPFTPEPRHARLYEDVAVPDAPGGGDRLDLKPPWDTRPPGRDRASILRDYARALASVDDSVGTLMRTLAETGQLDDTVVVYASDNGMLWGEHGGLWDKRAAYEPSIRIPLLMAYPRLVRRRQVCRETVLNIDLAPTLLDLAGVAPPDAMQGRSWLPLLRGERGREAFLYEYFAEMGQVPTTLALRSRRWKFITYPHSPDWPSELYDLQDDPGELFNLAVDPGHAADVARLYDELAALQAQTGFRYPRQAGPATPTAPPAGISAPDAPARPK